MEKNKKREQDFIKKDLIDDGNYGSGSGHNKNIKPIKDNQKLIISFILLVVLILMIALKANVIAGIVVAIALGVVIYLLNKEKESLK